MTLRELEAAIERLPPDELAELAAWFEEFQAARWDRRIGADRRSGRLDEAVGDAEREFESGERRPV
jgi:hypothetical protein